ncbi:MAG: beta-N-acetylglucosaminidase domain-containing protein [Victivallaceae bacterium]|nr:beta-N-acetylglucosaminidase domain-containing protein [Victivallaceae bacterium]
MPRSIRTMLAATLTVLAMTSVESADPADLIYPAPREILSAFQKVEICDKNIGFIYDPELKGNNFTGHFRQKMKEKETAANIQPVSTEDAEKMRQVRIYCAFPQNAGLAEKLAGRPIPQPPEQGYSIRIVGDTADRLRIVLVGADTRGLLYGIATLLQLITAEDGKLYLNIAEIDDSPVWAERYASDDVIYPTVDDLIGLAAHKISGFALQYRREWRTFGDENVRASLAAIKKVTDYNLLDVMLLLHIYAGPTGGEKFDISNEDDIAAMIDRCRLAAQSGVGMIMICADDWTPRRGDEYIFFDGHQAEAEKFDHSIGKAHGYLMRRLYDALKDDFPRLRWAMVGAPYSVQGHGIDKPGVAKYVHDWGQAAPHEVFWVWTGPEVCSPKISKQNYQAFADLLNGQDLFVWDNSNCFDGPMPRWETELYPELVTDSFGILYWNDRVLFNKWQEAYTLSANAYAWNPEKYNPVRDYDRALAEVFGPDNVAPLMRLRAAMVAAQKQIATGDRTGFKQLLDEFEAAFAACCDLKCPDGEVLPIKQIAAELKLAQDFNSIVPEKVSAGKLAAPIKVDGVIDPTEWKGATRFTISNRDGLPDPHPTKALIGYDDRAVYLAFVLFNGSQLPELARQPLDFQTFLTADNVEIFLQPSPSGNYGHFCFDYAGNRFDEKAADGGYDWNPDWSVAVKHNDPEWTAEVAIPLVSLEPLGPTQPSGGALWRMNIFRITGGNNVQAWSRGGSGFHSPQFFGEVVFK